MFQKNGSKFSQFTSDILDVFQFHAGILTEILNMSVNIGYALFHVDLMFW